MLSLQAAASGSQYLTYLWTVSIASLSLSRTVLRCFPGRYGDPRLLRVDNFENVLDRDGVSYAGL